MRTLHLLLLANLLIVPVLKIVAQEKSPVKFGKISVEDFDLSKYNIDSSASAVVIADIGSSSFEGNVKGWFTLVFKHQKRIKIINKNGFDAANITIPLYFDGRSEERLEKLKAVTYNVDNGKVIETRLETGSVFKDKISKNKVIRKFTFPAVKEGSVIEYSYTVESDFLFNLQPWQFQGDHPVLWSEYEVKIPQFFRYVFLNQGYIPYYLNEKDIAWQTYSVVADGNSATQSDYLKITANVQKNRWVLKDVPALKEESFTSSLDNYISKIEFQLAEFREPLQPKQILGNWQTVNEELMKDEDFGAALSHQNNWLDDDMKTIMAGAGSPAEKAQRIYCFVRDNFTCTNFSTKYLSHPLRTVLKNRNGSVAEINMLLIAMLRHGGIEADPVLLSTRDNGLTSDMYPLIHQYNYVIAEVRINNSNFYLDATHFLGFGKLNASCYNGHARVLGSQSRPVYFESDSLVERKVTSVFMVNDEKEGIIGRVNSVLGYYESLKVREQIRKDGESNYFQAMKSAYATDLEIKAQVIDSLKRLEQPLQVHFDFNMNMNEDIIYFNPIIVEGYKENFFKAAERKYPVEMPYTFDETFVLSMEVPKDYSVEEIPKSARVSFNENEGAFEYSIANQDNVIRLRTRVLLKKANFLPEDYASLREFFSYIVKKHSEQIVLKKKKV